MDLKKKIEEMYPGVAFTEEQFKLIGEQLQQQLEDEEADDEKFAESLPPTEEREAINTQALCDLTDKLLGGLPKRR